MCIILKKSIFAPNEKEIPKQAFERMDGSLISQKIRKHGIVMGLFFLVCYFPIFHDLGKLPIKNFDESLFALRAYSLAKNGEYLYNYNQLPRGPSTSTTKPPFFSAIQALSFRVFGYNELALRLPVAMCVVLFLIVFLRFSKQEWGTYTYGYFCGLILVTSWGFINVHGSRTGDQDVPLALMGLAALLYYYKYLKYEEKQRKYLLIVTFALIAATLTKGIAGLFFGPAILLYTLYKRKLISVLKDPFTWYCVAIYLFFVVGYNLYREWDHPGFLTKVWLGEVGGHYGATRDHHIHPFSWYMVRLYTYRFNVWLMYLPIGIGLLFHPRFRSFRDFGLFILTAGTIWLLVVSGSKTKLAWYDCSLYPLMALLIGLAIYALYEGLKEYLSITSRQATWLFSILFVLAIFARPYYLIIDKVLTQNEVKYVPELYGYLIKKVEKLRPELKDYTIVHQGHTTHAVFYQLTYNDRGYDIKRLRVPEHVTPNRKVMICQPKLKKWLKARYEWELIEKNRGCELIQLKDLIKAEEP